MKHNYYLFLLSTLFLMSCTSLQEENTRLQNDVWKLKSQLRTERQGMFEKYEYPRLLPYAKQGYDWFWKHSVFESMLWSHKEEKERVLREDGLSAGDLWNEGWYAARAVYSGTWSYQGYAVPHMEQWSESPTLDCTVPSEGAPSDAQ